MLQFIHSIHALKRKHIGAAVVVGIIILDVLIYNHQEESYGDATVPICYPSGRITYDTLIDSSNLVRARQKALTVKFPKTN